jgi:hypothetical protein
MSSATQSLKLLSGSLLSSGLAALLLRRAR